MESPVSESVAPAIIAAPRSCEEWLLARRNYLTASDVASVLEVPGAYGTPFSVWESKVGPSGEEDEMLADYVLFGRDVEGAIATGYSRKFGRPVEDLGAFVIQQHPDIQWLGATLDRVTGGSEKYPAPALGKGSLELKAPAMFKARDWKDEDDEPTAPTIFIVQAQIQMACSGLQWASLAALFGGVKLGEPVDILRDDRFLRAAYPALEKFWLKVQRREIPEVDGRPETSEAIKRLWGKDDGTTIKLTEEDLELADALEAAKEAGKKADDRIQTLKNQLKVRMGANTFGQLPDRSYIGLKVEPRKGHVVGPSSPRVLRRHYPSKFLRRK